MPEATAQKINQLRRCFSTNAFFRNSFYSCLYKPLRLFNLPETPEFSTKTRRFAPLQKGALFLSTPERPQRNNQSAIIPNQSDHPFYAKQTQFAQCSNKRKYCCNNGLSKYSTLQKPGKQTQSNPPPPNRPADYKNAKQTQFPKTQNEPNHLYTKGIYKYTPSRTAKKQTQFRTRRIIIAYVCYVRGIAAPAFFEEL